MPRASRPNGHDENWIPLPDALRDQMHSSRAKTGTAEADLITEDSAAQRFVEVHHDRLRFCHELGCWYEWDGAVWRQERAKRTFQLARELARELSQPQPDKVRSLVRCTSFASGVERFARSDPAFAVTADWWDRDPMLLGTPTGTVDLRTGHLRPTDPVEAITRATAIAPADHAECPLWLRFLDQVTSSDRELIRFLQQWCGYSLTGLTHEQALVFIFGPGGNGKGVLLNVVTKILGTYAVTAAMDTFTASGGSKHPTDLAMLRGARVVTASETEEGHAWAESRVKQMTGGDQITARFMRRDFFTYRPQFKLTIVGNHKPVLRNVGAATRRRFNIIPFTRTPSSPDRYLEGRLISEGPGILRWMIEGCLDWQQHGLLRPRCVAEATESYFEEQDLLGQWLTEECDLDRSNTCKREATATLFRSWQGFAHRASEVPGTQRAFSESLEGHGIQRFRNARFRGFSGISLRPFFWSG